MLKSSALPKADSYRLKDRDPTASSTNAEVVGPAKGRQLPAQRPRSDRLVHQHRRRRRSSAPLSPASGGAPTSSLRSASSSAQVISATLPRKRWCPHLIATLCIVVGAGHPSEFVGRRLPCDSPRRVTRGIGIGYSSEFVGRRLPCDSPRRVTRGIGIGYSSEFVGRRRAAARAAPPRQRAGPAATAAVAATGARRRGRRRHANGRGRRRQRPWRRRARGGEGGAAAARSTNPASNHCPTRHGLRKSDVWPPQGARIRLAITARPGMDSVSPTSGRRKEHESG